MRGVQPLPSVWLTMVFFVSSTNFACSEVNVENTDTTAADAADVVASSVVELLPMSLMVVAGQSVNCARHARFTSSSSNSLSVVKCPARAARDNALHFLLLRLLMSAVEWIGQIDTTVRNYHDKDTVSVNTLLDKRD